MIALAPRFYRTPNPLVIPAQFQTIPHKIPVVWEGGAFTRAEAASYLRISLTQLWKLTQTGKIRKTSYGTYPKAELDRHLKEEVNL